MGVADLALLVVVLAGSGYLAWLNVGRAWLFVRPGALVIEPEAPADQTRIPDELSGLARELAEQGFVPLGSHAERSWHRKTQLSYDFAMISDGTFATLSLSLAGERWVSFWTWTADNGFLHTANHRRPVREEPGRYQSSYLENATIARLYKAHTRRLEGAVGQGPLTLEGRVEAARAWLRGPGREEIRQQHLSGLLWTLGTLGMVAAAVFGRR